MGLRKSLIDWKPWNQRWGPPPKFKFLSYYDQAIFKGCVMSGGESNTKRQEHETPKDSEEPTDLDLESGT